MPRGCVGYVDSTVNVAYKPVIIETIKTEAVRGAILVVNIKTVGVLI